MADVHLARGADERPREPPRHVLIDRQDDFGLRAIALDHRRARLEAVQRAIDGRLAHAARERIRAEPLDERRKLLARRRRRRLTRRWRDQSSARQSRDGHAIA